MAATLCYTEKGSADNYDFQNLTQLLSPVLLTTRDQLSNTPI